VDRRPGPVSRDLSSATATPGRRWYGSRPARARLDRHYVPVSDTFLNPPPAAAADVDKCRTEVLFTGS
jgi:hypothetical protein